jgi:uncharacterized protein
MNTLLARAVLIAVGTAIAVLFLVGIATNLIVDWTWFSSLGYGAVFWTAIKAKLALFFVVFAATASVIWLSGFAANRLAGAHTKPRLVTSSPWDTWEGITPRARLDQIYQRFPWKTAIAAVSLVLAAFVASSQIGNWDLALKFVHQVAYGKPDPLYGNDVSFYLFSLPAYIEVKNWLLVVLFLSTICAAALYWVHGGIVVREHQRWIAPAALAHAAVLLAAFFAVEAWSYFLDRYLLVYSDNGVVVGAGYADVHVSLPLLWILIALCCAGAIVSLATIRTRTYRLPFVALALVLVTSIVISPVFTALFERIYVKPNELSFEAQYIARNIASTREAFRLGEIEAKPFPADETLSYRSLQNNRATIDNIRLWDWQPLLDTYAQLQEIRTYYKFHDADIDRYQLGNADQQVMLSARELESSLLPENAQTWVNLHLLFTHGTGVVMSPVTRTTPEGLPIFYLRDIPPVADGGPPVTEARIYFGEAADSYVIVKGTTPEFDYPRGDKNVYASYTGKDGVPIGNIAARALFAWYNGDINILLSEYITGESRILFRRNIQQRISTLAPFLRLDADPYLVISRGHLFWIQDAYTTSTWFPYSKPVEGDATNYVRNAVKIVIDAYNGTTDFYVSDPKDAIIRTYAQIFPVLFKPLSAMPDDLRKHVRYPEDLFQIQAELFRAYHMTTPEVFYNREDLWQFPRQPNALDDDTANTKMAPYYINMRLPGEAKTEFVLMLPMVPSQRENMIAWLAARCDQPDYGKLVVYQFPKDKLVYGPFQIEALINQNTEISQQISLWNQMGSRVIRGNLLVVPIENSILYVTPLYLRAQSGQMPELQRVIAIYGDHVVMEQTLAQALAALFKAPAPTAAAAPSAPSQAAAGASASASVPVGDAARAALEHYDRALAKLKAGDWSGFGAELDALKPVLEQLNRQQAAKAPARQPAQ